MACTNNTDTVELDVTAGVLTANVRVDPDPANALDSGASGLFVIAQNETGWFAAGETWVYSGADSPSFAFAIIGDKTAKYSPRMRVRLKQGGGYVYFIVTAVSYDAGSGLTTVTMYGGTSNVLANAVITDNGFSWGAEPVGFPSDPTNWTVELLDTGDRTQASPSAGTWYNPGALLITIPVGAWHVDAHLPASITDGGGTATVTSSLSTASNSESDTRFSSVSAVGGSPAKVQVTHTTHRDLVLAAKTTYYVVVRSGGGGSTMGVLGSTLHPTVVTAISAYL